MSVNWKLLNELNLEEAAYNLVVNLDQLQEVKPILGEWANQEQEKDKDFIEKINTPVQFPDEIISINKEDCAKLPYDGITKSIVKIVDISIFRISGSHYDVVTINGTPYKIPLPHR